MYNFSYFKEEDQSVLLQFMADYPFAFLSGSFADGQQAGTQLPVLVEEREGVLYLQGHIMRNTDHHKAFLENPNALVVFTGPSCYVSASWYSNPHMGSTWNYMSVYVKGTMRFVQEPELIRFMKKMTLHFEKNNGASPTIYENLAPQYVERMIKGIAGFEIRVDKLENVFKLSQNRDEKSYRSIITKLETGNAASREVAHEMTKRIEKLFPPGVAWDESRFLS